MGVLYNYPLLLYVELFYNEKFSKLQSSFSAAPLTCPPLAPQGPFFSSSPPSGTSPPPASEMAPRKFSSFASSFPGLWALALSPCPPCLSLEMTISYHHHHVSPLSFLFQHSLCRTRYLGGTRDCLKLSSVLTVCDLCCFCWSS